MPLESRASRRHEVKLRVQQCVVTVEQTGTGIKREHFSVEILLYFKILCLPPRQTTLAGSGTPDLTDRSLNWKDVSYKMQALSRKVAHRLWHFCTAALKRVSKGLTQKVLSKVLYKIHLKKDR